MEKSTVQESLRDRVRNLNKTKFMTGKNWQPNVTFIPISSGELKGEWGSLFGGFGKDIKGIGSLAL